MLNEFVGQLEPKLLGQLVEVVFEKMKLAGEAGSLLKIEDEIRGAIAEARRQWIAIPIEVQGLLFGGSIGASQQQQFDFSGITESEFFEQAEDKVTSTLRSYAEQAHNGHPLQRQLFTEDAVRGFGFIDVCHNRYDVVLMNPPFGVPSKPSKLYLEHEFANSKNDLFATFIDRGLQLLSTGGCLGAITSRTGCFLTSFAKWRDEVVLKFSQPRAVADLGSGILDTALVETAAYVLEKTEKSLTSSSLQSPFFRLLADTQKASALGEAIASLHHATSLTPSVYLASPSSFRHVPGSPFSYWAGDAIRSLFTTLPAFDDEHNGRSTRCGLGTLDDFRFIRLRWEVNVSEVGTDWRVYYHGGVYSPFHDEFPCVVLWRDNGAAIKSLSHNSIDLSPTDDAAGEFEERFVDVEPSFVPGP